MDAISQIARFCQSVIKYSYNFSVQAAMNRFNISRASIYRWRKRFNGETSSLKDRSRSPHQHPNQHSSEELKLIVERYYQYTAIDEYSRFRYI